MRVMPGWQQIARDDGHDEHRTPDGAADAALDGPHQLPGACVVQRQNRSAIRSFHTSTGSGSAARRPGRRRSAHPGRCTARKRRLLPATLAEFPSHLGGVMSNWPCEICGQSFTGDRRRRTSGKLSCQRALHTMSARSLPLQPRVCIICGVEFMSARGNARYCSSPCRQRAYRQRLAIIPPPRCPEPRHKPPRQVNGLCAVLGARRDLPRGRGREVLRQGQAWPPSGVRS
jgi:hypothetical protein